MMQHEWVIGIWSKRTLGPHRLAYMEAILRVLREAGFSVSDACDGYHAITLHIEGVSMQKASFPVTDFQSAAAGFIASVENPDEIPYFIEHVQHHIDEPESSRVFGMMLKLILDGFESRLTD